ncbi:hypothetical protein C2845_PM09G13250 [Panicum miliaceum]|uniref:Gypsy-type retrotransposon n=1 Tax=Panicum miliaceum TaxID=4540 RepID=A0A3L6S2V8_PANMI|nr:hypothetical protein C2845_PM09G13250 [Panicum miliaceum]
MEELHRGGIPLRGPDRDGGLPGGKYPEAIFKDNNKKWAEEWFIVANPAPGLPPSTVLPPVLNAKWEEKPTEDEMVEMEVLLAELQKLTANKLTGAAVALSFAKRLTKPIQERVHPGYEYSGCNDPTRGRNRRVSLGEAFKWVSLIMNGEVHDKGCPKAHCLKQPTTEIKGQQGKAMDPPVGLALPVVDVASFSSDSSIGIKSDDVVDVSGPGAVAGAKGSEEEAARSEPPRDFDDKPLEVVPGEKAKVEGAEDPTDPDVAPRVLGHVLRAMVQSPKGGASRDGAVVTKVSLLEAAQRTAESAQAASQLQAEDGSADRVRKLEGELQALKRHHSEASRKQSVKIRGLSFDLSLPLVTQLAMWG